MNTQHFNAVAESLNATSNFPHNADATALEIHILYTANFIPMDEHERMNIFHLLLKMTEEPALETFPYLH